MGDSSNGRRRVVISGVGMVSPLGNDPDSTWQGLVAGESGAGPITHFDTTDYDVHFACELKDFDPTNWIDRKQARRMDRFSQLALSAARMAEADSGVAIADAPERVGAAVATGIGPEGRGIHDGEVGHELPQRAGTRADEQVLGEDRRPGRFSVLARHPRSDFQSPHVNHQTSAAFPSVEGSSVSGSDSTT